MAIINTLSPNKSNSLSLKFADNTKVSSKTETLKSQIKNIDNSFVLNVDDASDMDERGSGLLGQPNEIERDELASLVTMFRQRREWEKKTAINSDTSLDQILDDDQTLKKVDKLFTLIKTDISLDMKKFFSQLRQLFPDESDMLLALKSLLRRKSIGKKEKAKLEAAIDYLQETVNPKVLKGGVNVALKARLFSTPLEVKPAVMRNSYRHFLEDENEPLDIYFEWVSQFGYEKRNIVIEFIESALLADMMSLDPSCSKIEFGNLLGKVKNLNELYSTEVVLFQTIKTKKVLMNVNESPVSWFSFFYYILKSPDSIHEEMKVLSKNKLNFFSHQERGEILQTIYQLVMSIPIGIFENSEYRDQLRNSILHLANVSFKQQQRTFSK